MAKKICLVPVCDECGEIMVGMIYYNIGGKDLCLKCTAKKIGFKLKYHSKRNQETRGGEYNA